MLTTDIHYMCFGGGGVRGAAYAGCIDELRRLLRFDFTKQLRGVAGTSIGALYASALAYGLSTEEILQISRETSLIDLVSPDVSNLLTNRGLDGGQTVVAWIDTFLGNRMKTFGQFYRETRIHLKVFVTNLNSCASECISHETHPDMPVAKGVFMSMCLPPLFSPVDYNGSVYVDGGIMQNFPVSSFEDPEHTIGFNVKWGLANNLDGFESYFSRLTYCTLTATEKFQLDALPKAYKDKIIEINCGNVSTLNWRIQPSTARAMEVRGRESARAFVRKHNLRALPLRMTLTSTGTQTEGTT
jgi:predicted acylesterase/phospholipase RssA